MTAGRPRFALLARAGVGSIVVHALAEAGLDPAIVVTSDPRAVAADARLRSRGRALVARAVDRAPGRVRSAAETALFGARHDVYRVARAYGWAVRADADAAALAALDLDLLVVFGFGLLPAPVLAAARQGAIGFHPSLLPAHRGASPLFWSALAGETETGFSLFRLDQGIDTGRVIARIPVSLSPLDDAASALARMSLLGARALVRLLLGLAAGEPLPEGAPSTRAPLEPRAGDEACAILPGLTLDQVQRRVRAGAHLGGAPYGADRVLDVVAVQSAAPEVRLARGRRLVRYDGADGRSFLLLVRA